jgi:RNA-directed DNA polymerase
MEVYNRQVQIYDSSASNDIYKMRFLQKQLVNSAGAKLLAVRKVTQDNRGIRTPGIDGRLYTTGPSRLKLASSLRFDGRSDLIKKVLIPKGSGTGLRPLGIPTVRDRAAQALMLLVLEPEWEAKFDTNSFGFRPGYSAFDAKWLVTRQLQGLPKFFLNADIKSCFKNINHEFLLKKLNTIRIFEHQIRA